MPKRKALDGDVVANLRAQLKALLPAFEQFLNEEAAEPAHSGAVPGAEVPPAAAAPPAAVAPPADPAVPDAGAAAVAPPADPAAVPPPQAAAPAAPPAEGGGGGDPAALLAQLEAIMEQLRAALGGGGGEAAPPAEGGGEAPPSSEGGESPPSSESNEPPKGDTMPEEEKKPEGDAVEGLNEDPNSQKLTVDEGAPEGQGTASPGPAAGKHTGKDAALRSMYADTAAKNKLVERLSKVVGTFDGAMDIATATASDVAAYGVKKLKLNVTAGQETVALDAYLTGVEATRRSVSVATAAKATADAAASEVPAIANYFKG